jgi:hypothetical protein
MKKYPSATKDIVSSHSSASRSIIKYDQDDAVKTRHDFEEFMFKRIHPQSLKWQDCINDFTAAYPRHEYIKHASRSTKHKILGPMKPHRASAARDKEFSMIAEGFFSNNRMYQISGNAGKYRVVNEGDTSKREITAVSSGHGSDAGVAAGLPQSGSKKKGQNISSGHGSDAGLPQSRSQIFGRDYVIQNQIDAPTSTDVNLVSKNSSPKHMDKTEKLKEKSERLSATEEIIDFPEVLHNYMDKNLAKYASEVLPRPIPGESKWIRNCLAQLYAITGLNSWKDLLDFFVKEHPRLSHLLRMNFEDFQNRYGPVKELNVPIGTTLGQHKPKRKRHKPSESDTGSLQSDADFVEDSHRCTDRRGCGTLQQIKKKRMPVIINDDQAGLARLLLIKAAKNDHNKCWKDVITEVTKDNPELSYISEINAQRRTELFGKFEDLVRDVELLPKRERRLKNTKPKVKTHDDTASPLHDLSPDCFRGSGRFGTAPCTNQYPSTKTRRSEPGIVFDDSFVPTPMRSPESAVQSNVNDDLMTTLLENPSSPDPRILRSSHRGLFRARASTPPVPELRRSPRIKAMQSGRMSYP